MSDIEAQPNPFSEQDRALVADAVQEYRDAFVPFVAERQFPKWNPALQRTEFDDYEAGLPLFIAAACVSDEVRLQRAGLAILEDARSKREAGIDEPVVIDAGSGSGVLSFLTHRLFTHEGLNPTIVAVEIEPETYELGKKALELVGLESIIAINGDARDELPGVSSSTVFDTVISENCFTGLAEEQQLQITDALARRYGRLGSNGELETVFIPRGVDVALLLAHSLARVQPGAELTRRLIKPPREAGEANVFSVDFSEAARFNEGYQEFGILEVEAAIDVPRSVHPNMLGVRMRTRFGDHPDTWLEPNQAPTLGNDHYFAIPNGAVRSGEPAHVTLSYRPGGPFADRRAVVT